MTVQKSKLKKNENIERVSLNEILEGNPCLMYIIVIY